MIELKENNTKTFLNFKFLKCAINTNILWPFERHKPRPRPNYITLRNVPEHAGQTVIACSSNCVHSVENSRSVSPPRHWSVSVRCSPLGLTETAQCSIGPVALSSCTVHIQWHSLCSYCSVTDWQRCSGWYSAALCTESDFSFVMPLPNF